MRRRSRPRVSVSRPERRFNSIHWSRSANPKISSLPLRCRSIGSVQNSVQGMGEVGYEFPRAARRSRPPVPESPSSMARKEGGRPVPETTSSGVPIRPHYGEPPPGVYPFTRGISEEMYRSRLWTMRQYAGFGSAAESNRRYRYLLAQGQTGLSVAFDLPTQMGYDADDPMASGEVGKVGVAIDSIEDM